MRIILRRVSCTLIIGAASMAFAQTRFMKQDVAGGEGDLTEAAKERYESRAFPNDTISVEQLQNAIAAAQAISKLPGGKKTNWQLIGPNIGNVAAEATYTGTPAVSSGRV